MNITIDQQHTKVRTVNRLDYEPPAFSIETVDLTFQLLEEETLVTSVLSIKRASLPTVKDLALNGEELTLLSLELNQIPLTPSQYEVSAQSLVIFNVPDVFTLKIIVRIFPHKNKALSGLYRSAKQFCTQCEAEGFRRITYFLDRPDVLSLYTTTIIAEKARYPSLLSNGNLIKEEQLSGGRHAVTWHDPFKKPSYLFALVAGDFQLLADVFETQSKRKIDLRIYVEQGLLDQTEHAMRSVKAAMAWDEVHYGREYDLDVYMIVAIGDFNMGAMENKGLNIFNTKYVLAKQETATDDDYIHISSVIAHEYFHNWTGNRVTCRDWFQLSLKEGLTIFRDQSFSEDFISAAVMRIRDVKALRETQFPEDAGPTAHSVRPDSYIEINNFYTATIYNKGAEVLRMLRTIVGRQTYRKAMDTYFSRFDGQAVTIDDYVNIMQDISGIDLTQFKLWYSQAGTPLVEIHDEYDAIAKKYRLTCRQSCPATPDQPTKLPLYIPIRIGFLNETGKALNVSVNETECVLHFKEHKQVFEFNDIHSKPIPSLMRGFSAPVRLKHNYTDDELLILASCDDDAFNRYEAAQQYFLRVLLSLVKAHQEQSEHVVPQKLIDFFSTILTTDHPDLFFISELMTLPSEKYIGEQMQEIDVDAIHAAREFLLFTISTKLSSQLRNAYEKYDDEVREFKFSSEQIGKRQFKNTCFSFLLKQISHLDVAMRQFHASYKNNMTDQLASLNVLSDFDAAERKEALHLFYEAWSHDALVMDKWLAIQAGSQRQGVIDEVEALLVHPTFDLRNPNKVFALIGTFGQRNHVHFHDLSGRGYALVRSVVEELDSFNPQIAARMVKPLLNWQRYSATRQQLMQEQLEVILQNKKLSMDLYELVSKSMQ